MQSWPELDMCLITYPCNTNFEGISSEIISNLLHGNFIANLNGSLCQDILSSTKLKNSFEEDLKGNIQEYLNSQGDKTKHYEVLCLGVSSLQLFVQVNWTGPPDCIKYNPPLQFLRKSLVNGDDCSESEWMDKLSTELVLDGEAISPNIQNLELLLVARAVLNASFEEIVSAKWWRLRCLMIHQQVLEERSPIIYSQLKDLLQQLSECESVVTSSALSAQLQLEAASLWFHYSHVSNAGEAVKAAHKQLGLSVSLVGALGKRTKFQEKEVAQLTLCVDVDRDSNGAADTALPPDASCLPKDVRLEDDVRLNQIAFSDSDISNFPMLTPAEQAAILAACMHKQKSQPKDNLHLEEIYPYLTCLTAQPRVWAIQMSALLQRSKLDSEHRRTVERGLMQFQSLSESVRQQEPYTVSRLAWVYCSYLPPAWRLEALLAHTYVSLGMVQTALDIFLRLQLWEEVIACYNFLKLRHKAAEIIRQELEKKQTVNLLCLLGDATDDVDCYKQGWELSGERSGRAQRHWAMYYFSRKQYAESIPHLEKSLSINSLQESLWFRLGYAALDQENWKLCATAYRRYCALEPDCFEAWNNLAKAYVKTGQKDRAYRALQEAVKCNYENWQVWDNMMAVSTDCGLYDEVIRSYHRILDLKEKHLDLEVLKILKTVAVRENSNVGNLEIKMLRKQVLKLFGRLTSQVMNNSTLWRLYAEVAATEEPTPENRTKIAQYLQHAYRAGTQGSWERDTDTCLQVMDLCMDLAEAYIQCSMRHCHSNEKVQMLSSAKLPLKSVLTKIEKEQTDLVTGELPESLASKHKSLLSWYEKIVDEIQRLQAS
ncbi:tetratricopeptide repeat protein 27 [Homalodisca vitripennis]|uniref:tetratricopeptide repeat protein 27 n=1 Tax=Homalodisca vitripennis TaxID=197043 RepID=UPI001EEC4B0C|nr:tetratricopeptide repeat protein 27 [Homalodisca vitripennis]